jgi:hypothetical protein
MTTMDHLDPFETHTSLPDADTDPERITGGRYRLPDLTVHTVAGKRTLSTSLTSRKGGWQRVTTMVKAIADARALDLWHQRQMIVGMVLRPDLLDLAAATLSGRDLANPDPALRGDLEDLAQRVLLAAGSDVGANLGTAFHGFAEAQDLGMMHYARRRWHGRLANYASGMEAHRLTVVPQYVERRVVILKYGLCGTLDRILRDEAIGALRIGDLKSQKRFWTWLEISAQLAAYQMADAMWDRPSLSYVEMPPVADDVAVVAWAPEVHPEEGRADGVDFFDVDLEKGREILALSHTVDRLRAEVKSKGQTVGLLRPLPEMSIVEAYAKRLSEVTSRREGSAVWGEICNRGLSEVPELIALAREAVQAIDQVTVDIGTGGH